MMSETWKVIAHITNGRRLLVFRHTDFPEAGIQVPAGTVDRGETPETAVLREAQEETGLEELILIRYLGERRFDQAKYGREGQAIRHYFHLRCPGQPPARWRHHELFPSEGSLEPIEFELYWARWPDKIPPLAAEQDTLLATIDWDSLPD